MNIKRSIVLRVRIAFLLVLMLAVGVIYRIFVLQVQQGAEWRKRAEATTLQYRTIKATRGNIYSDNGSLLATSLPFYRVSMDPTVISEDVIHQQLDSLSMLLSRFYGDQSKSYYKQRILNARKQGRQYLVLNRMQVGYQAKKTMQNWPIFRYGRYKGGVIFEKVEKRLKPFSTLANRTIGYLNENESGAGLEYSFNDVLKGYNGSALFRRVTGGNWKQVLDDSEDRPREGADVVTTLDVNLQDVSETALLRHLEKHNADRGCVVVMEVETGYIKAMANLARNKAGYYSETYNYAVGSHGLREPGSTFKLASVMALLEDAAIKPSDTVDTGDGAYKFYKETMRDHKPGGYGKITLQEAFEVSSNIAVARLVNEHFGLKPERYMQYVRNFGLADPLGFQLKGEGMPKYPPLEKWSGITLPWIAHGYGFEITPLQTLAFYNAVANNGKMMRPLLVSEIRQADKSIRAYEPTVIHEKIASEETLQAVREMLLGVVERGTAQNIKNENYHIAGKTGTAQTLVNGRYTRKYYTSFVGFFPAEDPKYSAIVVIDNPKGYSQYGSDAAAPVFKEIADKIYARDLQMHAPYVAAAPEQGIYPVVQAGFGHDMVKLSKWLSLPASENLPEDWVRAAADSTSIHWRGLKAEAERVPDMRGMMLRDALYILENKGMKVTFEGQGRVVSQSQLPGTRALAGSSIHLKLKH